MNDHVNGTMAGILNNVMPKENVLPSVPSNALLAALSVIDAQWDIINKAYHRAEHFSEGSILMGGDYPAIGDALGKMWHAKEQAKHTANASGQPRLAQEKP